MKTRMCGVAKRTHLGVRSQGGAFHSHVQLTEPRPFLSRASVVIPCCALLAVALLFTPLVCALPVMVYFCVTSGWVTMSIRDMPFPSPTGALTLEMLPSS